jgi:hypothetical protein
VRATGPRLRAALVCGLASMVAAAGCSGEDDGAAPGEDSLDRAATTGSGGDRVGTREAARARGRSAPSSLPRASCPAGASNCRSASGRVLYVERVDPDGDGDAHFVLASRESVTAPGISVIDVKRSLRPSPLPGPGERLSAAGPVHRGSYGQRQIEAVELNVAREP